MFNLRSLLFASLFALGLSSLTEARQRQTFSVCMSGEQENPPVVSTGSAEVSLLLNLALRQITVTGTYSNLQSAASAAHMHGSAAIGVNAGIIGTLSVSGGRNGTISGTFFVGMNSFAAVTSGLTYLNLHTTGNPSGEIRGQVVQLVNSTLPAELASDPRLADNGGSVGVGPKIGNTNEPFNVSIDCGAAVASGFYFVRLSDSILGSPAMSPYGFIFSSGAPFMSFLGAHTQSVESVTPA